MLFGSSDPPLADQRSVMVAETGLTWQDDGEPALLQVALCSKSPLYDMEKIAPCRSLLVRGVHSVRIA